MDASMTSSNQADSAANAGRRFLATLFGVECSICMILAVWPGLVATAGRAFGVEIQLEPGLIRFFAIGGAVSAAIARAVMLRQSGPSSTEIAWAEFASQTGGSFSTERRRPTVSGWEGGPTVRWTIRGTDVTLRGTVQNRNSYLARFQCAVRLSRPIQFAVSPRNLLTRALSSPRVWGMLLAVSRTSNGSGENAAVRQQALDQMAFLATPEQTIGDPAFDEAFLLKSSDEPGAREIFSDSGVGHWLRELNGRIRGWSLTLMGSDTAGGCQVMLDLPGLARDPEALRAAYSTVDAVIARLRDRGWIALEKTAA
jgi:hypothetical protein